MGGPEDAAAEKYFTPPTLTDMLVNSDTSFHREQLTTAKEIFKDWLRTVSLPDYVGLPETRKLLITLVDEP